MGIKIGEILCKCRCIEGEPKSILTTWQIDDVNNSSIVSQFSEKLARWDVNGDGRYQQFRVRYDIDFFL